jgi:hypothetical protein
MTQKNSGCRKCVYFIDYTIEGGGYFPPFPRYFCKKAPKKYHALRGPVNDFEYCEKHNKDCECRDWELKKTEPKPKKKPWWKFW